MSAKMSSWHVFILEDMSLFILVTSIFYDFLLHPNLRLFSLIYYMVFLFNPITAKITLKSDIFNSDLVQNLMFDLGMISRVKK